MATCNDSSRLKSVYSNNIGTGGDGKDIALGADGIEVATDTDDGNHLSGHPKSCHQVVARFSHANITILPAYFSLECLHYKF